MRQNRFLSAIVFWILMKVKAVLRRRVSSLRLILRRSLACLLLLGFGDCTLMPCSLNLNVSIPVAWSQDGFYTCVVRAVGRERIYERKCDTVVIDITRTVEYGGWSNYYEWGASPVQSPFAEYSQDLTITFTIFWHGTQAPRDTFLALHYDELARLGVAVPVTGGSATASFGGNLLSANVSLRGCDNPTDEQWGCSKWIVDTRSEVHPYYISQQAFTMVQEGLWKAEVTVPYRVRGLINGSCPPSPLPGSGGFMNFSSNIECNYTDPKFVWVVAQNEPSYHKGDDCIAVMNNAEGPLDERYGDTVVELCGDRRAVYSGPGLGNVGNVKYFTDWYLGNSIVYTRMLHGDWCPEDCPLNEWWICGAYYKDNLFHEFTSVNAVIGGCPKTDCEEWYIGTELGWNDEPSLDFWLREDVRKRVSEILSQLPSKYQVILKVTDNYGNGSFSDSADYTMVIHAPLENYTPESSQYVYLPQQVGDARRPCPTCFILSPSWGATILAVFENWTEVTQQVTQTITASDTYTLSTTISGECSASAQRPVSVMKQIANLQLVLKFGASRTVTTAKAYQEGLTRTIEVPPHKRVYLCTQRAALIETGSWDVYGWDGYLGTIITTNLHRTNVLIMILILIISPPYGMKNP